MERMQHGWDGNYLSWETRNGARCAMGKISIPSAACKYAEAGGGEAWGGEGIGACRGVWAPEPIFKGWGGNLPLERVARLWDKPTFGITGHARMGFGRSPDEELERAGEGEKPASQPRSARFLHPKWGPPAQRRGVFEKPGVVRKLGRWG
jgi:hypothetical protein